MTRNTVFPSASSLCQTYQLPQELQVKQLQEHFKNGIQELSGNTTGNGGMQAVMHFTNSIREINTTLLAACFLNRATAYELLDRRDLALKDIYQSISHSPQSSAGYIHAYNLLVSSNQLRQGLLAINQGVHQVNPRDSKFAALRYMKDALLAEIDKRNALPVPYDIVTEILYCLSFRDRVRLATTCKYWQRMLRDSPPVMWHDIDIRQPMGQEQFQRLLGHVESDYVHQIKVDTKELLSQVVKMKWHHIRKLDTETIEVDDVDLLHVLTHNKDTLQQLNVSGLGWIIERTTVFMRNVIKTCSNLTHLTIHTKLYKEQLSTQLTDPLVEEEEVVAQQSTPATTRRETTKKQEGWYTPLIFLSINEVRYLPYILPHCPNLRYLELLEQMLLLGYPPECFPIIDQWCPKLLRLKYFPYKMVTLQALHPENELTQLSLYKNIKEEKREELKKGLRELVYLPVDVVDVGITDTIKKNIVTLRHLGLSTTVIVSQGYEIHQMLLSINTNALREIDFHGRRVAHFNASLSSQLPLTYLEQLRDLIKACPSLESVTVRDTHIKNDAIFFALGDLRNLRRVTLIRSPFGEYKCKHNRSIIRCGFLYMFTNTKTLEEMYVDGVFHLEPIKKYFHAMKQHKGLRSIHFKSDQDIIIDDTSVIAHILTKLTSINIESKKNVMFPSMTFFHLLPNLQILNVRGMNVFNMTDDIVYTMFQKRRDLFTIGSNYKYVTMLEPVAEERTAPSVLTVSVYHDSTQIRRKYCSVSEEETKDVLEQKRGGGQQKRRKIVNNRGIIYASTYYEDSRFLYENEVLRVLESIQKSEFVYNTPGH